MFQAALVVGASLATSVAAEVVAEEDGLGEAAMIAGNERQTFALIDTAMRGVESGSEIATGKGIGEIVTTATSGDGAHLCERDRRRRH
jgi:hypothetical protein